MERLILHVGALVSLPNDTAVSTVILSISIPKLSVVAFVLRPHDTDIHAMNIMTTVKNDVLNIKTIACLYILDKITAIPLNCKIIIVINGK